MKEDDDDDMVAMSKLENYNNIRRWEMPRRKTNTYQEWEQMKILFLQISIKYVPETIQHRKP